MLKVSQTKPYFYCYSPARKIYVFLKLYVIIAMTAPKPRRRRPTTSSPLKKSEESSDIDAAPTVRRKNVVSANRRSEVASSDQSPAPSANRFRVRSKPKTDSSTSADNSTDFAVSKEKKGKDGYKVSISKRIFFFSNEYHSIRVSNR